MINIILPSSKNSSSNFQINNYDQFGDLWKIYQLNLNILKVSNESQNTNIKIIF